MQNSKLWTGRPFIPSAAGLNHDDSESPDREDVAKVPDTLWDAFGEITNQNV